MLVIRSGLCHSTSVFWWVVGGFGSYRRCWRDCGLVFNQENPPKDFASCCNGVPRHWDASTTCSYDRARLLQFCGWECRLYEHYFQTGALPSGVGSLVGPLDHTDACRSVAALIKVWGRLSLQSRYVLNRIQASDAGTLGTVEWVACVDRTNHVRLVLVRRRWHACLNRGFQKTKVVGVSWATRLVIQVDVSFRDKALY